MKCSVRIVVHTATYVHMNINYYNNKNSSHYCYFKGYLILIGGVAPFDFKLESHSNCVVCQVEFFDLHKFRRLKC